MLAAPCFTVSGHAAAPLQPCRTEADVVAVPILASTEGLSGGGAASSCLNASYGAVGACFALPLVKRNRRRARRARVSTQVAIALPDVPANFAWKLEATSEATHRSPNSGDPATSMVAFFSTPVRELDSTPMAYGASLKHAGRKMSPSGSEEEFFEVQIPKIEFPGMFSLQPVSTCFVKSLPGGELSIEGNECLIRGGPEEFSDPSKQFYKFDLKVHVKCVETPEHSDLMLTGTCRLSLDPPENLLNMMPKDAFESVGNMGMKAALDQVMKGFAQSFGEDYEKRWAVDADYRASRAANAK